MVRHPLPFPFVQMLIASSPLLGNEIGATGAKHVADALMSNSSLTQLNLRCAPLLISFPHPLAQMLIAPSPLLGNQIGTAGECQTSPSGSGAPASSPRRALPR